MQIAASAVTLPWWAVALGLLAPWATIVVTLWLGLKDLTVKAKAEAVEADVKLLQTFSTLAPIADARGEAFFSEVIANKLFDERPTADAHVDLRRAVAEGPVSASQQAAVIAAIAELGDAHDLLRAPAKAMLTGLKAYVSEGPDFVQNAYEEAMTTAEAWPAARAPNRLG